MISLLDSVAMFIAAIFAQGLLAALVLWPIGEQDTSRGQVIVFCILSCAFWITISGKWHALIMMATKMLR